MIQDPKNVPQQNSQTSSQRSTNKEVDLFPAIIDRSGVPSQPIRQGAAVRGGTQISMFAPISYDEALDIVACLRGRSATTISLEKMRKIDADRLVDFIAGASAALDGEFEKLNEQVYLFCPSNIRIVSTEKQTKQTTSVTPNPLDYLYPTFGTDKNVFSTFKQ